MVDMKLKERRRGAPTPKDMQRTRARSGRVENPFKTSQAPTGRVNNAVQGRMLL